MNKFPIDTFDFLNHESTIALIQGYFRNSGFLDCNIRIDDFIPIVCNYCFDNKTINIGNNHKKIKNFCWNGIDFIDALNKQFIIAGNADTQQLLCIHYVLCCNCVYKSQH